MWYLFYYLNLHIDYTHLYSIIPQIAKEVCWEKNLNRHKIIAIFDFSHHLTNLFLRRRTKDFGER